MRVVVLVQVLTMQVLAERLELFKQDTAVAVGLELSMLLEAVQLAVLIQAVEVEALQMEQTLVGLEQAQAVQELLFFVT
jgi:hypothetical protein